MRDPLGLDLDDLIERTHAYKLGEAFSVFVPAPPMDPENAPDHGDECTCEACRLITRMPDETWEP